MEQVPLEKIVLRPDINIRSSLNQAKVKEYAECLSLLPPIMIYVINGEFVLVDGLHRYHARKNSGQDWIMADVKGGTLKQAQEAAIVSNIKHGIPYTATEKVEAIKRMLILFPERSNNWLAIDTAVSDHTIKKIRATLISSGAIPDIKSFEGRDGKEYQGADDRPKNITQVHKETASKAKMDLYIHLGAASLSQKESWENAFAIARAITGNDKMNVQMDAICAEFLSTHARATGVQPRAIVHLMKSLKEIYEKVNRKQKPGAFDEML